MEAHDLEVIATAPSEIAAHHLVSLLADAGIEAIVRRPRAVGPSLAQGAERSTVLVATEHVGNARAALRARQEAAAEIDWDAVDLGDRLDSLPLSAPGRKPWGIRIALAAIVLLLLGTAAVVVIGMVQ